ncbi:MAG: hypothetical protein WCS77_10295, partial [Elusimicrobiaceae bacterium]
MTMTKPTPPKARKNPHKMTVHRDTRIDDYFWLNKRGDAAVLDYLKAENRYTERVMKPSKKFEAALLREMKARIKKDDASVPVWRKGHYYYVRYKTKSQYPLYCRKKGSLSAKEEILLDENKLARGHKYFDIMNLAISPDGATLAYTVDTQGRRICSLFFKDLKTAKTVPSLEGITHNSVWAQDGATLFYVKQDPATLRHDKVYRLNPDRRTSVLVYEEKDEQFDVSVGKTATEKHIVISSGSSTSDECRLIPSGQ